MLQDENESSDEIEPDCDISTEDFGAQTFETEDAKQKKTKTHVLISLVICAQVPKF